MQEKTLKLQKVGFSEDAWNRLIEIQKHHGQDVTSKHNPTISENRTKIFNIIIENYYSTHLAKSDDQEEVQTDTESESNNSLNDNIFRDKIFEKLNSIEDHIIESKEVHEKLKNHIIKMLDKLYNAVTYSFAVLFKQCTMALYSLLHMNEFDTELLRNAEECAQDNFNEIYNVYSNEIDANLDSEIQARYDIRN